MGIGENAHIAFNDPANADFQDPLMVKAVALDAICRKQQVNDGCFKSLEQVPTHAITLTVPMLFSARYIFCIVPARSKANGVYYSLSGEISEKYPASILRTHRNAVLYLDEESSSRLSEIPELETREFTV
jgi:glucosamine-6-phosphate deaminase